MSVYRICFATPLARPILDPDFPGDFGGAEVRAVNFAQGLAEAEEFEVSMVLNTYASEPVKKWGPLEIHFDRQPAPIPKTRQLKRDHWYYWNVLKIASQKLHRSLQKRRDKLRSIRPTIIPALQRAPADVYCVFGVHHYAANVAATAKQLDRRSLLFLASDTDLDPRYTTSGEMQNDYRQFAHMCRFALMHCDKIIAQTPRQQQWLLERFGRRSTVIRNPIDLQQDNADTGQRPIEGNYVLWVGRADTFSKRADKCFELAGCCPSVKFVVILNKRDETTFQRLAEQAPPNAVVVERVPFAQIEAYFRHATALVNTSDAEGFPNAFLQAGKYGVPIFSLHVDPGEMISRHQCGFLARGDLAAMGRRLVQYWQEDIAPGDMSQAISNYTRDYHELDARVDELRIALLDLMSVEKSRGKAA